MPHWSGDIFTLVFVAIIPGTYPWKHSQPPRTTAYAKDRLRARARILKPPKKRVRGFVLSVTHFSLSSILIWNSTFFLHRHRP